MSDNTVVITPDRDVTFDTTVVAVRDDRVALDPNHFYAGTPGQPTDTGRLAGTRVTATITDADGTVWCQVDDARRRFVPGQTITASVDHDRRIAVQRLQTLQHLLYFGFLATHADAARRLHRVDPPVAHLRLEPDRAVTLDVPKLGAWVDEVVADDLPISRPELSDGSRGLYWQVDGVGAIACSGFNVASTGAVGEFVLMGCHDRRGAVELVATLADPPS